MKRVITTEKIPIKLWLDEINEGTLTQAKNLVEITVKLTPLGVVKG